MTTQHTPGPWRYFISANKTTGQRWSNVTGDGLQIAGAVPSESDARLIAAAPELLEELCNAREWLDELCGLIQSGMFDAASDWVGANAVSTDSTLAATIEKAIGEPVMAA
jgi:predicted regulator of Ras-like GTPase activity (Roadblock/LC7/MglB family)